MKKYRSETGWIFLGVTGLLLFLCIGQIVQKNYISVLVLVSIPAMMVHLWLSTYYIITEDTLKIYCSFLVYRSIPITDIRSISRVYDVFGAPALSLKRLLIRYGQTESIAISPVHAKKIIEHLLQNHPSIKLETSL